MMTNEQKQARRTEIMSGLRPEVASMYSAMVDMLVELESKIDTIQKAKLMNKKLQTIAPEAQLYKQLTTQYAELHKELMKASAGTVSKTPLDAFFEKLMEDRA